MIGGACLDIKIADNQGKMCKPIECFIVPITVIESIEDETIVRYRYNVILETIIER